MRVETMTAKIELDGDYGPVESVQVTCGRCGYWARSHGTDKRSVRRCAAQLRENCPRGERNYYVV